MGTAHLLAADASEMMPIVVVAGGILIAIVAIVSSSFKRVMMTRQVEQTKREIAAYVAEGTITPEDAAKLLGRSRSDFESKIGTAVSWGMISAGKAERLIKALREDDKPQTS